MGGDTAGENADERLARNLRTLRERAGMSQDAIAAAMAERGHPWHQSTVYRVESGRQTVRFGEAADLAEILGTGVARFTWTSPEALVADFVTEAGARLHKSGSAVADAVAGLLAARAYAERVLAAHEGSRYPRVQEARKDLARRTELYDPAGCAAEGERRYEERDREGDGDDGKDAQGQPGVVDQQ